MTATRPSLDGGQHLVPTVPYLSIICLGFSFEYLVLEHVVSKRMSFQKSKVADGKWLPKAMPRLDGKRHYC